MPLVTPNVFTQTENESFADVMRFEGAPDNVRITHIVHPYVDRTVPLNNHVQEVTFETMRRASAIAASQVRIRHVGVTLPGETDLVPADFVTAEPLSRTVGDIASFAHPRNLPLLFDILDRGIAIPEEPNSGASYADYIVYTNSDIHLQPTFYQAVVKLIALGYDAITINRRTISQYDASIAELPFMCADLGSAHPGYDCFVFRRELYGKFVKSGCCVGAPGVMCCLLVNLAALSPRLLMLKGAHLTFHVGNDKYWQDPRFEDYRKFNLDQSVAVVSALAKDASIAEKLLAFLTVNREEQELMQAAERAMGRTASISLIAMRTAKKILRPIRRRLRRMLK